MIVQSLGWHRSSSTKNDSKALRDQKLQIFWMLYSIDKNLSLRLGHASFIQDYDVDLLLPHVDPSAPLGPLGRINIWVESARVTSLVYQQLYSPGALKQTDTARFQAVKQLLEQVEDIQPKPSEKVVSKIAYFAMALLMLSKDNILQFIEKPRSAPPAYLYDITELILKSDEITYYALLCMIYRATPTSAHSIFDPAIECIKHARAALDCHERCTAVFKVQSELWAMYLHW
jgi:hypothetical protein